MHKSLTVAEWKKAIKGCPDAVETEPVTKALEALAKADGKDATDELVKALDLVLTRAAAVKSKNKGKPKAKDVVEYVDDVIKEAEKEKSKAVAEKKKQDKEREKEEEEEEEDEEDEKDDATVDPVVRKTRKTLKARLALVRKTDAADARPFVVALGKLCGLMIAKGPSAGSEHRKQAKLLREGSGRMMTGTCWAESGKLLFAFDQNVAKGLARGIKATIVHHTKLGSVRVRVIGPGAMVLDDETDGDLTDFGTEEPETEEETEGAETTGRRTAPEAPPSRGPGASDEVKALAAPIRDVLARLKAIDAGRAEPLSARLAAALAEANEGRNDEALAQLQTLDRDVQTALREAAEAGGDAPAAEYQRRSAALAGDLKTALQKGDDRASELKVKYSEAQSLARGNKYAEALEALKRVEDLLAAPVGSGGATSDPTETAEGLEGSAPALAARAKALAAKFKELSAEAPQSVARFRGVVASAVQAVKDGGPDAEDQLDYADGLLSSAARAAAAAREIAAAGPARTVGFRKARDDWDKARDVARKQMEKFQTAVLADKELHGLPEWPDIQKACGQLVPLLDVFDDSLAQAIDDAQDTDPTVQTNGINLAAQLIREYRQELAEHSIYGTMDNGQYGAFKVHDLLSRGLDQVATKLGI